MKKTAKSLVAIFLAVGIVHNTTATDYHWTGLAGDGLWSTASNWDNGVPPITADGVYLDPANGSPVMTIVSGETEWPGYAHATNGDHANGIYGMIYGSEWGATLNIHGTINYDWYLAPVQSDPSNPSIINMYDGSSISGEGIGLGDNWWYWGGPYVVMNMYGNATAGINWLYWGGQINLYDMSVMNITNGVTLDTEGLVSDATRSINLDGGTLVLPGSFTATVNDWISRGILMAYDNTNDAALISVSEANTNYPGRTVVSAIPVVIPPFIEYPVYGDYYAHDPSTMIKQGTNYFIWGDGQGIAGQTTTDLRNWTAIPPVFPGNPPAWTTNAVIGFTGYFWAPDIAYFNGRFNLYYACSDWGTIDSAIGLVTTPSLVSPVWTDQGKVVQSNPVGQTTTNTDLTAFNCIDPSILLDTNGTVWMSFGSYSDGILIMQLDPSTGKRIATNSPIYLVSNNGPVFFSNTEEASYLYQRGGYYYLFMNWGGCCAGIDSTYNIRVGRSTSVTGPYYDKSGINLTNGGGTMVLESTARFIGPGQAAIMNDNGTNWFTYHYYDGNNGGTATLGLTQIYWSADGWPLLTNDWSAFYPFNNDAHEHLRLYNGTLESGAFITNDPGRGNVLNLDGISNYVLLPDPVANCSTIATWVKWNGGATWQRIFDFGTGTTSYFFLTPMASSGNLRFAISTNGNGAEQQINAPFPLPTNSWCHVAVTLDGTKGLLYLNGNPVGTNYNLTIRPWQTLARSNYLGHSQFPADPLFGGEIGSFRIFGRALSGPEIKDLAYAHPALAHRYSFTSDARDSIGMSHGQLMGDAMITNSSLNLDGTAGTYVNLPGGLVSGSSAATIEFWATFGAEGDWARVFDFGNISGDEGQDFLFFTPHNSSTDVQMGYSVAAGAANLVAPGILDNSTVHVVCIVDPTNNYCAIYTNGVLQSALTNSLPPLSEVSSAWSFIGRSMFSADAWLNATIYELRIYDGRLTPQEISVNDQYGPYTLALPVTLTPSNSAAGLTLFWPSWAIDFAPQSSTNLAGGVWTPFGQIPMLAGNQWSLTVAITNSANFYRLQR